MKIVFASRGRKPTPDSPYIQKMEISGVDYTNTLTTAAKDNLVLEVFDATEYNSIGKETHNDDK